MVVEHVRSLVELHLVAIPPQRCSAIRNKCIGTTTHATSLRFCIYPEDVIIINTCSIKEMDTVASIIVTLQLSMCVRAWGHAPEASRPQRKELLFLGKLEIWHYTSWLTDTASNGTSSRLNQKLRSMQNTLTSGGPKEWRSCSRLSMCRS